MSDVRGQPLSFPSLMGSYLAVNAVSDAFLLVDGPDCALYKAHYIHGRHDMESTLLDIEGRHRICFTNVCAQAVTKDHDVLIVRRLRALDALPRPGLLMVTAMPGCSLTGMDYGRLLRALSGVLRKPAFDLPPTSLVGDWIDGYAVTLRALARQVPLAPGGTVPDRVALVGYLMDRNEGEHRGNIAEMRRLLAGLSLDLASVWLGGQRYAELGEAGRAGLIVSLPHGREAARELAARTGAALVEASLPFGLGPTQDFLRAVARATGRQEQAEAFIAAELRRTVPKLEWLLPHLFLGRRVLFVGEPHRAPGFADIAADAGLELVGCAVTAREGHLAPGALPAGLPVVFSPDTLHPEFNRLLEGPIDLAVTNANEPVARAMGDDAAVVETGFPSYYRHALSDTPDLGFRGFLAFLERMAEALGSARRRRTHRPSRAAEAR